MRRRFGGGDAGRGPGAMVWVTGATGFLGSATCDALCRSGFGVTAVTQRVFRRDEGSSDEPAGGGRDPRRPGSRRRAGDSGHRVVVACDLAMGPPPCRSELTPPDAVVHLAAEIPPAFEGKAAERSAERNRAIDRNVFDFAVSQGAAVVFASSGSVYGEGRGQVFTETDAVSPRGPYAAGKADSERRGVALTKGAGLPFAALRISAPYGPGQRTRTVVRHFLERAMAGERIEYHGSGSRMQDFVYVTDVADAVVRCLEAAADGVFNVASGRPVTMRELAEVVAAVVGDEVGREVDIGPSGQPDPQEGLTADYAVDAIRSTGWEPRTTLREGLECWRDVLAGSGSGGGGGCGGGGGGGSGGGGGCGGGGS